MTSTRTNATQYGHTAYPGGVRLASGLRRRSNATVNADPPVVGSSSEAGRAIYRVSALIPCAWGGKKGGVARENVGVLVSPEGRRVFLGRISCRIGGRP